MQTGPLPRTGALDRAHRARAREREARAVNPPTQDARGQWHGHHTDDEVELNGASGAGGGYVGLYGGVVAAAIGGVTGDKGLFMLSLATIAIVGFVYGVLSGEASGRGMKASIGNSLLYGSLFSFLAFIVGAIVSVMVMIPVLMVLIAIGIGRYGT
ncbi:MAG: hypothetical protein FI703_08665 [SAR202 cluster bacterium]|nr:hypothetical protein [SAR202 cluster bacterium]